MLLTQLDQVVGRRHVGIAEVYLQAQVFPVFGVERKAAAYGPAALQVIGGFANRIGVTSVDVPHPIAAGPCRWSKQHWCCSPEGQRRESLQYGHEHSPLNLVSRRSWTTGRARFLCR